MGINASPTCVMAYEDAVGYLIGEPNQGMRYMFRMMNTARLSVGLEGLAVGDRAYQQAVAYAKERVQGRPVGAPADSAATIIEHADVRRMLLTMKAHLEALRCLLYLNAESIDLAKAHPDEAVRDSPQRARRAADADLQGLGDRPRRRADVARRPGARRHGLHRGDRRRPALSRHPHRPDLRGHQRDPGDRPRRPQARPARRGRRSPTSSPAIDATAAEATAAGGELALLGERLAAATRALRAATEWLSQHGAGDPNSALAGATPYLRMAGLVTGGWLLTRSALAAAALLAGGGGGFSADFLEQKLVTARFYATQLLPQAAGLLPAVTAGAADLFAATF